MRVLEPYDLDIIAILRRLPDGLPPEDRETLARDAHAYVGAFLRARRSRSRFGFRRPFREIVDDVAAWEIASLLCPTGEGVAGERLQLEVPLGRVVDFRTSTDEELLNFLRRLLRIRGEHGLVAEWKREHSHEARLLKLFKRLLDRGVDPRIRRDPRGHLVVSAVSRLDLPQVPDRELEWLFANLHLPVAVRLGELPSVLKPGDGHGGWCYLLDLVHAAARIHRDAIDHDAGQSGAGPSGPGSGLTQDGVPLDQWEDRIRRSLGQLAEQYLESDARKAAGRGAGGAPAKDRQEADTAAWSRRIKPEDAAYAQVCVEMICRGYDLRRPEWADLSQAELLRRLLPTDSDAEEKRHRTRVDYLIRRVRSVWEARTPPESLLA